MKIFFSHSSDDKSLVREISLKIYDFLDIWVDEKELLVGEHLLHEITKSVNNVDYVVLFLSNSSIGSEWVKKEIELSLEKEKILNRPFLLPIVLGDCQIPEILGDRFYLKLYSQKEKDIKFLSEQLNEQLFKLVIKYGHRVEEDKDSVELVEKRPGEKLNDTINIYGNLINNLTQQCKKKYVDIIKNNISLKPSIVFLLLREEANIVIIKCKEYQNDKNILKENKDKYKNDDGTIFALNFSRDELFRIEENISNEIVAKLDFISNHKNSISEEEGLFLIKNIIDNF